MKATKIYFFILIALASAVFSCGKKDDDNPNNETLLAGNSEKEWRVSAIKGSSPDPNFSAFQVDVYNNSVLFLGQTFPTSQFGFPIFPECAKDDIIVFKADKTYQTKPGANVCSGSNQYQLSSGTWEFRDGGKKLIIKDPSGQEMEYSVTKLTETTIEGETTSSANIQGSTVSIKVATTFVAI